MTEADSDEARELLAVVNQVMPFGKFRGRRLIDLPEPYLVWFWKHGFPEGLLGRRLAAMHEIKVNGLEKMLQPLVQGDALPTARPKSRYRFDED